MTMWAGFDTTQSERALDDRIRHPLPPRQQSPSGWAQAGAILNAPMTGIAQGVNESLRVWHRALSADIAPDDSEVSELTSLRDKGESGTWMERQRLRTLEQRAQNRKRLGETDAGIDQQLRGGAEYWQQDPKTATFVSGLLHEGARVVGKAAGYGGAGGVAGTIAGTSVDEGATAFMSLRDKGVDVSTATKAAGVRTVSTAVGLALPVAGATIPRTIGIAAVSGPGLQVGETYLTREILERADYADLAAQHDPWDVSALAASMIPGAVVGAAVHVARARRVAPEAPASHVEADATLDVLAQRPELQEAAHVALSREVADARMLAEPGNLDARTSHLRAMEDARAALDEGRPVDIGLLHVDPARAVAALGDMGQRLRAAEEATAALEPSATAQPPELSAAPQTVAPVLAQRPGAENAPAETIASTPMRRAEQITAAHPDLPVRLDENDTAHSAADFMTRERTQSAAQVREIASMYDAAIRCALSFGD
jgi:hypothetical protein